MAKIDLSMPPEGDLTEWLCELIGKLRAILCSLDEDNMTSSYNKKMRGGK